MSNLQMVLLIAIGLIVAAALGVAGWAINALDRRVTKLEDQAKTADTEHRLLVNETRQAFDAYAALFNPGNR